MSEIAGFGFTITITWNGVPVQVPDTGVTLYVTACTELVMLEIVSVRFAAPLPEAPPVNPAPEGADHE